MGYDPVATAESSHGPSVEMKDGMEQQRRQPAGRQVVWGPNGSLSGIMRDLSVDPFSRMSSSQSSQNSNSQSGSGRQQMKNIGDNYDDNDEENAVV